MKKTIRRTVSYVLIAVLLFASNAMIAKAYDTICAVHRNNSCTLPNGDMLIGVNQPTGDIYAACLSSKAGLPVVGQPLEVKENDDNIRNAITAYLNGWSNLWGSDVLTSYESPTDPYAKFQEIQYFLWNVADKTNPSDTAQRCRLFADIDACRASFTSAGEATYSMAVTKADTSTSDTLNLNYTLTTNTGDRLATWGAPLKIKNVNITGLPAGSYVYTATDTTVSLSIDLTQVTSASTVNVTVDSGDYDAAEFVTIYRPFMPGEGPCATNPLCGVSSEPAQWLAAFKLGTNKKTATVTYDLAGPPPPPPVIDVPDTGAFIGVTAIAIGLTSVGVGYVIYKKSRETKING